MGVAQAVTNGLVPVTQSLAVGFIPWTEAVTWGLTNDFAGNPRPAGLPVTAGAFHVDVAEIGVATEDAGEVVSGAALSYGSVDVNGTGSMTFLVTNAGLAALDLSSVAMSGGDAAEFLVDTHSTEPCVQPGCSTAFRVSFRPTSTGLHTSTLRLVNNDSDECVFTLTLTGVGSNLPPHWTGYTLSTPYQKPATVSLVKLLARATDPEGDGFAVTAVGPSAGGGGVNLGGSSITYVPPGAFSGFDSLPVTLRDARGAVTTGTVTVTVGAGIGIGMNQPRLALSGGGRPLVRFQGIPGRRYDLQRSTNLMTWSTLTNIAANATGGIEYEDTAPPAPQGFYRLRAP
jgi:hypothetical protein